MAEKDKSIGVGKIKEKLQEVAGSLDDTALNSVSGGTEASASKTCVLLCGGGKEKTAE